MRGSSISSEYDIESLAKRVSEESFKLQRWQGQRDAIEAAVKSSEARISSLEERQTNLKLIEKYLAAFADERQAQVYKQVEYTVTEGLVAVFHEDIKLEITNKMVGSRQETVFTIVSKIGDEELRTGIMDARGGGVAAIVGFLIQAVLVLLTPGMSPIIFLDESFRGVSSEYQLPLGEFIQDLCKRTGLQVILVTHQPVIAEAADTWYSFSQRDGKTKVKREL